MEPLISLSSRVLPPTSKLITSSPLVGSGTLAWNPRVPGLDGDSAQKAELIAALSYFLIQTETVITSFDAVGLRKLASGISPAVVVSPVPKSSAESPA